MNRSKNYRSTRPLKALMSPIEVVTNAIYCSQSTRKRCIFGGWWKHLDCALHRILEMKNVSQKIQMLWRHVCEKSGESLMHHIGPRALENAGFTVFDGNLSMVRDTGYSKS